MKELITIIIPVYNVEKYIKKCVESICKQTYENIEIILINDGSTDSSGAICEELKKNDNRINVITIENSGVSTARNIGMQAAKGNYIGFVDSDDWIDENMYEILYKTIKQNNSDMAICDVYIEKNKTKIHKIFKESCQLNKEEMFANILGNEGFNWAVNKLYSSKLVKNIRFNEKIYIGEDILFICECVCSGSEFSYVAMPLYHYFFRKSSAFNIEFNLKKVTNICAYREIMKLYESYSPYQYIINAIEAYILSNISVIKWITSSRTNYKNLIVMCKKNINNVINEKRIIKQLSLKTKIKIILLSISPQIMGYILRMGKK